MRINDDNGFFAELGINPEEDTDLADAVNDEAEYQRLVMALISLRNLRSVSQDQVAAFMGTRQSAVSRLETGLCDARYSTLQRYARALGARLESWLRDDTYAYLGHRRVRVEYKKLPERASKVLHFEVERG